MVSSQAETGKRVWEAHFAQLSPPHKTRFPEDQLGLYGKSHLPFPELWENICQHITAPRGKDETNCFKNYFTK